MTQSKLGKLILSFALVAGAVVSTAVDWNTTHRFNPAWHSHARFHDALFLLIVHRRDRHHYASQAPNHA